MNSRQTSALENRLAADCQSFRLKILNLI